MRLLEVGIKNFKSLRDVTFKPGDLNVLIGPNGAGKSNLADALDFIGEIHRLGLDRAVAGRGGYENICFRHSRRSKAPMSVRTVTRMSGPEARDLDRRQQNGRVPFDLIVDHSLSFSATGQQVSSPFKVVKESIEYKAIDELSGEIKGTLWIVRNTGDNIHVASSGSLSDPNDIAEYLYNETVSNAIGKLPVPSESMLRLVEAWSVTPVAISRILGSIFTSQISVWRCREQGAPGPNPRLGRYGDDLPVVISDLKARHPESFRAILSTLMTVMPTLNDIDVFITPQRMLGLSFKEDGFGRPWTIDHVSDGTVRLLGLMVALFDPDSKVTVIDEPENSLHPWAIGQFIEACRLASRTKQIVLTTHSPVVVDQLKPEEVWVVAKPGAGTKIDRLVDLDPVAQTGWEAGDFTISEFLDSGVVPGTVPAI